MQSSLFGVQLLSSYTEKVSLPGRIGSGPEFTRKVTEQPQLETKVNLRKGARNFENMRFGNCAEKLKDNSGNGKTIRQFSKFYIFIYDAHR